MNAIAGPNPLEILLMILFGGGFGVPASVPPTPEDPVAAQVAPAEPFFYVAWAGTGTPDAASKNHCERLLAEPEIQDFLKQSSQRLLTFIANSNPNNAVQLDIDPLNRLLELVSGKPGAFFISDIRLRGNRSPAIRGGGLLRIGADADQLKNLLDTFQNRIPKNRIESVQIANHPFTRLDINEQFPSITWGLVDNHLIFGFGQDSVESMMQRLGGPVPNWLTDVRTTLPVERPTSVTYINLARIFQLIIEANDEPEVAQCIQLLGLDNVQSMATVNGLDDTGFVTRSLLTVDGAGRGLLSWIEAAPLTGNDLQGIGRDAPVAIAFKLDPARAYDFWIDVIEFMEPREAQSIDRDMRVFKEQVGISIRDEFLESLGDTWRIHAQPGAASVMTGWTFAISARNPALLAKTNAAIVAFLETSLAHSDQQSLATSQIKGHTIHTLELGQPGIPIAPSWCVTEDALYITLMPSMMEQLFERGGTEPSLIEIPEVKASVGAATRTLAIMYVDTQEVAETLLPPIRMGLAQLQALFGRAPVSLDTSNLPPAELVLSHLQPTTLTIDRVPDGIAIESHHTFPGGNIGSVAPIAVAMLLPAVTSAREAARRAQSMNQMKQINLALLNFESAQGAFPAGYSADADGKPLLSWRVHVLPYLEEGTIYDQFHLDEPWDSPHNKTLIDQMPALYRSPQSTGKPGMTNYLGVSGADGLFVRPQKGNFLGVPMRDIRDGTSHTIIIVEVPDESAITWTKPGDFAPDKKDPTRGLFGMRPQGFLAGYTDGHVQILPKNIDPEALKALFTKSGGERVINPLEPPQNLAPPAQAAPAPVPQ